MAADEPDPPRKFYEFKPKEFENVNGVPPPVPEVAPANPANLGPTPDDGARIDVKDLFRRAQLGDGPLLSPHVRPAVPRNDVHAILDENLARANAAGLNDLAPMPERVSKRKRAYVVFVILGNVFLVPVTAFAGRNFFARAVTTPQAALEFGLSISALVLFNLGLWWICWHLMDD